MDIEKRYAAGSRLSTPPRPVELLGGRARLEIDAREPPPLPSAEPGASPGRRGKAVPRRACPGWADPRQLTPPPWAPTAAKTAAMTMASYRQKTTAWNIAPGDSHPWTG